MEVRVVKVFAVEPWKVAVEDQRMSLRIQPGLWTGSTLEVQEQFVDEVFPKLLTLSGSRAKQGCSPVQAGKRRLIWVDIAIPADGNIVDGVIWKRLVVQPRLDGRAARNWKSGQETPSKVSRIDRARSACKGAIEIVPVPKSPRLGDGALALV